MRYDRYEKWQPGKLTVSTIFRDHPARDSRRKAPFLCTISFCFTFDNIWKRAWRTLPMCWLDNCSLHILNPAPLCPARYLSQSNILILNVSQTYLITASLILVSYSSELVLFTPRAEILVLILEMLSLGCAWNYLLHTLTSRGFIQIYTRIPTRFVAFSLLLTIYNGDISFSWFTGRCFYYTVN